VFVKDEEIWRNRAYWGFFIYVEDVEICTEDGRKGTSLV
jgi:hypothetical protein